MINGVKLPAIRIKILLWSIALNTLFAFVKDSAWYSVDDNIKIIKLVEYMINPIRKEVDDVIKIIPRISPTIAAIAPIPCVMLLKTSSTILTVCLSESELTITSIITESLLICLN